DVYRLARGCPRAEAVGRVGAQQAGGHQPGAVDRDQPRPPGSSRPAGHRAPHPDGARDRHRAGHQEGGDLDPAQRPVAEQARVVVREPEAVPGQPLDQDRGFEDGTGQDPVTEQRPGDALGGGAGPAGCADGGLAGHDGSSLRFGADRRLDLLSAYASNGGTRIRHAPGKVFSVRLTARLRAAPWRRLATTSVADRSVADIEWQLCRETKRSTGSAATWGRPRSSWPAWPTGLSTATP